MKKPKVLIIMGSKSDMPAMEECARQLDDFGAALAFLEEKGVRILGTPTVRSDGFAQQWERITCHRG